MALQVLSAQLPELSGFPRLLVWILPTQQITAADLQKVMTSSFFEFFPKILSANLLLGRTTDFHLFCHLKPNCRT